MRFVIASVRTMVPFQAEDSAFLTVGEPVSVACNRKLNGHPRLAF